MSYPVQHCAITALCHSTQTSCDRQVKVAEKEKLKNLSKEKNSGQSGSQRES